VEAELLHAGRQALWGRLAVANFFLGGAGAGVYVLAAVLSGFERSPILGAASALGPVLVIAGFLSVAAEAGRPLRGPFVLKRIRSSWMSRELWAGGAFIALSAADLLDPRLVWRVGAVLAALLLALAQGAILSRAKGVSAWSVPVMPLLFLVSALVSGAGTLILTLPLSVPGGAGRALEGWTAGLLLLSALVWGSYIGWPGGPAFRQATASFRTAGTLVGIFGVGHLLPLFFLTVGLWVPTFLWAALAGALLLEGQLQAKARLILRAGELRPITIPHFRLRRAS
jgi:formate-dependent nitrite reductase membrane component NrfD